MNNQIDLYSNIKYPFKVELDENDGYILEYPDLPGCITYANSLEEVIRMGEDAKKAWIETASENNIPIPLPNKNVYSGSFRLRMPKSLHRRLAQTAAEEGISMNQYCIYLLSKDFKQ